MIDLRMMSPFHQESLTLDDAAKDAHQSESDKFRNHAALKRWLHYRRILLSAGLTQAAKREFIFDM
jgi:hypothetical protein